MGVHLVEVTLYASLSPMYYANALLILLNGQLCCLLKYMTSFQSSVVGLSSMHLRCDAVCRLSTCEDPDMYYCKSYAVIYLMYVLLHPWLKGYHA